MEAPSPSSQPRIRSSIACARCRRSKIKCVNTGANTRCRACESGGRECVYPAPAVAGSAGPKREGDSSTERTEAKRPRVRKSDGQADKSAGAGAQALKESGRPLTEALDSSVLTPKVWQEVFDLFQLHFATDLPFLHGPTFLGPRCGAAAKISSAVMRPSPESEEAEMLPGYQMLLLGLLALTARFHPGLITYHSSNSRSKTIDPVVASEYYATVLRTLLVGEKGIYIGQPNIEKIQALLMLGLHEWGMCKGIKAWIHVGLAIRMAQVMGLHFDDNLDDEPWALSSAMRIEAQHLGVGSAREYPLHPASSEAFIDEEMRRRTFWSCFIMDRYLSSGKFRPAMLTVGEVRLQLPCSEHAFVFGERVCTNMITGDCSGSGRRVGRKARMYANAKQRSQAWERERSSSTRTKENSGSSDEKDDVKVRCETGNEEGVLSRFVRMVEIWGKIAKWSCAGGRRTEEYPPWHPDSRFFQLRDSLGTFNESIPRPLKLTSTNMQAHLAQRTSSPFTLLHVLHSLCLIVLHREYVPFVPIRCDRPEGPLDDPTTPDQPETPAGFWEESARQLFKAGRDIMDLVQACQSRGLLVETPILGFGLYTVAFVGVYAINFPHMDPDGYMCGRTGDPGDVAGGQQAARKALEMIGQMRSRLPMANNWFRTIHRVHRYYEKIIKDYRVNTHALRECMLRDGTNSPTLHRQLSLREGGNGGGNESFKLLEKTLKEFGSIEDEEVEILTGDRERRGGPTHAPDSGDDGPKAESRPSDHWTAVNSIRRHEPHWREESSGRGAPPLEPFYTSTRSDHGHPRPQPPELLRTCPLSASNPPSLTSPGSTTPSLPSASPYQRPPYSPRTASSYEAPPYHPPSHQPPHPPSQPQQQYYASAPPPPALCSPHPARSRQPSTTLPPPNEPHPHPHPRPLHHSPRAQTRPDDHPSPTPTWSQEQHSHWLESLKKPLGGDDVAAFVDGRSCEEWAQWQGAVAGGGAGGGRVDVGGWLSEVWGGGWGGG